MIEACNTLAIISEIYSPIFEIECEKYISANCLLKLINNSNSILADAGHKCIISILTNVASAKYLNDSG